MLHIHYFCFNDFHENTYVLWDETNECAIIDPGCYRPHEEKELFDFIKTKKLRPVILLNTHTHIDHVMGNAMVKKTFAIPFYMHKKDLPVLHAVPEFGKMYGIFTEKSPEPDEFLEEGDFVKFGNTELLVLFTPGHSPGSISFYNKESKYLISGDVLFKESIGRCDFPGGDYETLMHSITKKLLPLGDEVKVFSGHGPETTIGEERISNPFILEFI
jgi:hydroxyacylglutathione hydrolase